MLSLWAPLTCAHVFGELPSLQEEPEIAAFLTLHSRYSVAGHRTYNWSTGSRRGGGEETSASALFRREPGTSYFWANRVGRLQPKQAGSQSGIYWKHTNTVESLATDALQGLGTLHGALTGRHQEAPLHRVWKLPLNEHLQAKSRTSACQEPNKVLVRVPDAPAGKMIWRRLLDRQGGTRGYSFTL